MKLKPGQLCTINNNVFRAKKREAGCEGCFFENCFFTCPGVLDAKKKEKKIDCLMLGIVLKREKR